jgi:hypothetical protein
MSGLQFKVGGLLLLAVGLAVLVLGGYIIYTAWDSNARFNQIGLGGLVADLVHAMGATVSGPFQRGGILIGIGAVVATFGFYLLAKVQK